MIPFPLAAGKGGICDFRGARQKRLRQLFYLELLNDISLESTDTSEEPEYDNGEDFSPPSAKAFLRIQVSLGLSPFDANMIPNSVI